MTAVALPEHSAGCSLFKYHPWLRPGLSWPGVYISPKVQDETEIINAKKLRLIS